MNQFKTNKMKLMALTFVLIVNVVSIRSQDLETNNKCSYTLGKSVFMCLGLSDVNKNVDKFITTDTHMLVIKESDIAKFTSYHHNKTNYLNVVNYNILNNAQLEFEKYAFVGLFNLIYMKISGNSLEIIRNNTFDGLGRLELLNIAKNGIRTLENGAFYGLTSLITLDLSENNLKVLNSGVFSQLRNLNTLILERNYINTIEPNAFFGLGSLELLDISHNLLTSIVTNEFNSLENLHDLFLGRNRITTINGLFKLPKLAFLNLNNNKLQNIAKDTFKHLSSVKAIDLDNNDLSNVGEEPFLNIPSLKHLNLKNNNAYSGNFSTISKHISVVV